MSRKEFINKYADPLLRKNILTAAIICYVCAGLTFLVSCIFNPLGIIDAMLLAGLALGMHLGKNRVCAILILVLSIVEVVMSLAMNAVPPYWWLFAAISAVVTFNKIEKQYNSFIYDEKKELGEYETNGNKESISEAAVIILSGPLAGAEIPLHNQEVIYIGKDPQRANIVFSGDFPNVSRLHCSVSYEEKFNKYFVTDCSTNGTFFAKTKERFVQGKRTAVSRETILLLGDDKARIQLK